MNDEELRTTHTSARNADKCDFFCKKVKRKEELDKIVNFHNLKIKDLQNTLMFESECNLKVWTIQMKVLSIE